tara:strand:+ start:261 stop:527 length:267 start_codon:yes stop_codon:yes gene_type:complete
MEPHVINARKQRQLSPREMAELDQEGKQDGPLWSQYARCSARREGTSSAWREERETKNSSDPWQMGPNCKGFVSEHLAQHCDGLVTAG